MVRLRFSQMLVLEWPCSVLVCLWPYSQGSSPVGTQLLHLPCLVDSLQFLQSWLRPHLLLDCEVFSYTLPSYRQLFVKELFPLSLKTPLMYLGRPSFNNNRHNCKGSTLDYSEAELGKNLIKEAGMDGTDSKFGKYNSSKRSRNDGYDHESGGDSNKKIRSDASESEICRDNQKRSRYECTTCNKIFHSYQALGGHRASHKKVKGCFASTIECSENSIETDVSPDPTADSKLIKSCSNEKPAGLDRAGSAETCHGSKKSKGHECPFCLKVFASGQALGGHKRSHLVGGSESRGNQTIVIQYQLPEIHDLLDLNLPAPIDEETGGCMGFNSCWVGSNHKYEPLVGLISN